jgi:hypothetical protein
MRRILCVAAAALAFFLPLARAEARTPVFARTKCAGLYCMIVMEHDPLHDPVPANWRKVWRPGR